MSSRYIIEGKLEISEEVRQEISCSVVDSFEYKHRCTYVLLVKDCMTRGNYVNYVRLFFCGFNPQNTFTQAMCALFLLSFCSFLFLILATTIDKIFSPALKVIALKMHMNEHLAGVTLLAIGGSSPDFITNFASLLSGTEIKGFYSDTIASALYVSMFISSIIVILAPFQIHMFNTLRDVAFLLFTTLYVDFARSDNCLSFIESALILGIYFLYLLVIILDQIMLKRQLKSLTRRISEESAQTESNMALIEQLRNQAEIEVFSRGSRRFSRIAVNIAQTRKSMFQPTLSKNANIFKQFLQSLHPIDMDEYEDGGNFKKAMLVLRSPITFTLYLLIPIVDYEMPQHGWSKLLNCIQIVVLPILLAVFFIPSATVYGIPFWCITIFFTLPTSCILFAISRTDIPPTGHLLIAIFASAGSLAVIHTCAWEVSHILYVIGIVTNSSEIFLGATLLAWGMAIGDLVSNIILASHGYQLMGYAACFGSSLFNVVLNVGATFFFKTLRAGPETCISITPGRFDENCVCFLIFALVFMIIWMLLTNSNVRRSVAIFNMGIYVAFYIYTLLDEWSILHGLSSDTVFFPILKK